MIMVDYLQNYNMDDNVNNYFFMQPGDSYEAPLYTAKQAYLAAINTMQTNHPNDWVTLVPYSWPRTSVDRRYGRFNCVSSARWGRTTTTPSAALVSLLDHQRRWLPEQYRDHSLRPRPRHRLFPRPTSRTRRALTAIPASPWP